METATRYLLVATFGAFGAVSRYALDGVIDRRNITQFPIATLTINTIGSFLLGVLVVLTTERYLPNSSWRVALGVGFLAAFTTFSTFSYDTIRLAEDGSFGLAATNVFANVALGLLAVVAGMAVARHI